MQTDPIGYGDGLNLYAYVSGDPVNKADPDGLSEGDTNNGPSNIDIPNIIVTALRFESGIFNSITPNPAAGVATVAFGSGATLNLAQNDAPVTAMKKPGRAETAQEKRARLQAFVDQLLQARKELMNCRANCQAAEQKYWKLVNSPQFGELKIDKAGALSDLFNIAVSSMIGEVVALHAAWLLVAGAATAEFQELSHRK